MRGYRSPAGRVKGEYHLLLFSVLLAVAVVVYVPYTPGTVLSDLPVVIVPLGVSLALGLFTVQLRQQDLEYDKVQQIVVSGWAGTLISAAVSGWMIALQYYNDLPIELITDYIFIIVSIGLGAGVIVGNNVIRTQGSDTPARTAGVDQRTTPLTDRERVRVETSWTNYSGSTPILMAVTEALDEVEDRDMVERQPLYDYVDPDIFSRLREEDSQWRFSFYTSSYCSVESADGDRIASL
jgi:hypothetical protein